ncbi:Fanconi anemia group D2-like protein [Micractinium conductrix]|uniref:Fanconi anemia group D2-like protein n=1 Tax=Micractinium conductrix TaxID=554055 RepID=A0A2P6VNF6_9CHLO|nr:Fanconi anemia group D2-like protein [Micractinium conductrix]|eukprot:PSC75642.1 Fanconi anemia group D2-like protein [Micractinium conductrix]
MLVENHDKVSPSAGGKRPAAAAAAAGSGKRRRSGGVAATYDELLGQAGCGLVSAREGHEFEVEDPRKLRRLLEQRLTLNRDLQAAFMEGLQEQLEDEGVLHAALRPMTVTGSAPTTGDSFVRVLLNVSPLQEDVSVMMLERLGQFIGAEELALAQLVLGQFRWLDHVGNPRALTTKLLEVLPVCPEALQPLVVAFLPEVATEEQHGEIIRSLAGLWCAPDLIPPSIEALANLCLTPEEQEDAVRSVLESFNTANAADLPAVARFLLQYAAPGPRLKEVVATLRDTLHFADPSDPRQKVPDRKGKAQVKEGAESAEYQLLEAVKQAMQLSPAAADAVAREIQGVTEPGKHTVLDLWLLLVLMTLGADRRKAAEGALRKKFADGHAQPGWLRKAIAGHERVMAAFFPQLLSLAQQLLRAPAEPVQLAGSELYVCLFKHFTEPFNRQEVLRVLHGHLGAQVPAEASAALGVLVSLAKQHGEALLGYAAFLTTVLDYVEGYTDPQVQQVFVVLGELVARGCAQADAGGGGRTRMEDELMIFVRKQLSSAQGRHRRVGIIGTVALVQRLGAADSSALESDTAIGERYREAMGALKDTFDACQRSPEAFAFLCDELARAVARKAIGSLLVSDLHGMMNEYLEETFFCFLEEGSGELAPGDAAAQVGGRRMASQLWSNLDGSATPVALRVLPHVAKELEPGSKGAPLLALFGTLRLTCQLEFAKAGNLEAVSALLGCPLALYDQVLLRPQQFAALPVEQRRCVLLGLWYALNWCRELVNCFAGQLQPNGLGDEPVQIKLFARLRCCCQLEAVLDQLLQFAPPLFALPPLGNTLEAGGGGLAAAAPKKAAAKGGKAQGKKSGKQSVKFENADAGDASPSGGRAGGATSRQTTSSHSGGATTQGGGVHIAATQAVSVVAGGGLGQLVGERAKQRCLLLPALATLGVGAATQQQAPCYAMLPSAAYVLADLHGKLKIVLTGSGKRPGFPGRVSKQQLPPELADLTAGELLAALAPVLPCIRSHLDAACNLLDQELADEATEKLDQDNFWSLLSTSATQPADSDVIGASLESLESPAAEEALSPSAAAPRVRALVLDIVRQLLAWPDLLQPANRPLLAALLGAFHDQGVQDVGAHAMQANLAVMVRSMFKHFVAQLPSLEGEEPTTDSLSHQHAALLILDRLTGLQGKLNEEEPVGKHMKMQQKFSQRISMAAEAVLTQRPVDAEGNDIGSAAWKGRAPVLGDLLRLYLCHSLGSGDSVGGVSAAVLDLASNILPKVPDSMRAEDSAKSVGNFASLSGHTVTVWYRVCWEQLLVAWDTVVTTAVRADKSPALMDSEATIDPIIDGMQSAAAAYLALVQVVKTQTLRATIHVQAVKSGGKFVDSFFRVLSFWGKVYRRRQQAFVDLVTDLQKGTRILQYVCSEGKCKREIVLTSRVPAMKKTSERFVFSIKAFFADAANSEGVKLTIGSLKHRNLVGHEVPTQYPGADEDGEEAEEDEEEEEEGEDEC